MLSVVAPGVRLTSRVPKKARQGPVVETIEFSKKRYIVAMCVFFQSRRLYSISLTNCSNSIQQRKLFADLKGVFCNNFIYTNKFGTAYFM